MPNGVKNATYQRTAGDILRHSGCYGPGYIHLHGADPGAAPVLLPCFSVLKELNAVEEKIRKVMLVRQVRCSGISISSS